uniref:Uncharacterized protein n=1 Tax=Rhizophora mucronata TaxID=61149 RepID=A0A2P2KNY0_RHIMU
MQHLFVSDTRYHTDSSFLIISIHSLLHALKMGFCLIYNFSNMQEMKQSLITQTTHRNFLFRQLFQST